jgi:hypothetical protein
VRYRRPSIEVEAAQWTGGNVEEIRGLFGAGSVRPLDSVEYLVLSAGDGLACYVQLTDWIVGYRDKVKGGWSLVRLTAEQFEAAGYKIAYRDRNDHYVPDGLNLDGKPQMVEVSEPSEIHPNTLHNLIQSAATLLTGAAARLQDAGMGDDIGPIRHWLAVLSDFEDQDRPPRLARIAMARPDEHNREQHNWWWADMSGEPFADGRPHWAVFRGHQVQVDIRLSTSNRREVNEWKGRDEIRGGGEWSIELNRQPVYGDHFGTDVFYALRQIEKKLRALTGETVAGGLDHTDPRPYADQLLGRRIYYDRTPAVVVGTVLCQGCVVIKPVGVAAFPRSAHDLDCEPDDTGHEEQDSYDESEAREIKVHIDSPLIWWWRDRPYSPDEPDGRYRPRNAPHAIKAEDDGSTAGAVGGGEGEADAVGSTQA